MRFLIDACLPREFAAILASQGHSAVDVRDIGMRYALDPEIAGHAQANQLCLMTGDWGFADIRIYPPDRYFGIVVFEAPDNGIDAKVAALRNLLGHTELIENLAKRLAIVTSTKIRLRPSL